jgi:hypothetical protein
VTKSPNTKPEEAGQESKPLSDGECWQYLVDGDVDEMDIEQRLMAGITLQEQAEDLRKEYEDG